MGWFDSPLPWETLAGVTAGFLVSPLNVVVDKAVIQFANGKGSSVWKLAASQLKHLLTQPHRFFTGFSFRWMYFVYGSTYTVSNLTDHMDLTEHIPQPIQKLAIVFAVNTGTSLVRDKKYTQQFGRIEKTNFPKLSLALFFTRDLIAMAAAFVLPARLGPIVGRKLGVSNENGERIVQMSLPVLQQFITTPIHLYGLDLYNRPGVSVGQRFNYIAGLYANSVLLRMMRFLPAYGLGGVANTEIRRYLKNNMTSEERQL